MDGAAGEGPQVGDMVLYVEVMEDGMFQPLGVMTMGDMMDWADSQEALTGAGEFLFRYMELMPAGGP